MSLDAETLSYVDLRLYGADAYTRDDRTRCLMLAHHLVGRPEQPGLWLEGDPVPEAIERHARDGGLFAGWNVIFFDRLVFNRILRKRHGFPEIPDDNWRDSMHLAAHANLPRSLEGCGNAVGIPFEKSLKDSNRIRRITDAKRTVMPTTVREIFNGYTVNVRIAGPNFVAGLTLKNNICVEAAPILGWAKGQTGDFIADRCAREGWSREAIPYSEYGTKLIEDLTWLANRCVQDVTMEEQVLMRLPPWPDVEPWVRMPFIDRRINDRGVLMDTALVRGMADAAALETAKLDHEIAGLTGGAVPKTSNVEALKNWLIQSGVELPSTKKPEEEGDEPDEEDQAEDEKAAKAKSPWRLRKSDVADILARPNLPEASRLALALRAEAGKSSVAKLRTMLRTANDQGWLMNSLLLGGAQQTMRWSGSRWQPHNFPRDYFGNVDEVAAAIGLNPKNKDHKAPLRAACDRWLKLAIETGRTGDPDLIRMLYEAPRKDAQGRVYIAGVLTWVSRMLRRTLAVPEGHLMLNGDFAQVEARITAWLAQQMDVLQAFALRQDVYTLAAAGIYKLPPEQITKTMRQVGKVAVLALGFGGGAGALLAMAYSQGILITEDEAKEITKAWRAANRETVAYWYATDEAAANAVMFPGREFPVHPCGLVSYVMRDNCLMCRLPSGRYLRYWKPVLKAEKWSDGRPKDRLSLYGLAIKGRAIFERSLYHTILVENQVQGIAADMLGTALDNTEQAGLPIAIHVHDCVAAEIPEDRASNMLPTFEQCLLHMPAWTTGLPHAVDADYGARFG